MRPSTAVLLAAVSVVSSAHTLAEGASRFRLIRSSSGSRGTQQGDRFLIEDPRSVFQRGQDRQVVVLFEWQGPPGRHRFEGLWKDPAGRVVFTSVSELSARGPRFAVYWGLSLPDAVATGTWVLEAQIDGETAGVHAFQIVEAPPDPAAPGAPRALSVSELYQRGVSATLTIEGLDASGRRIGLASGLLLAPGLVLTTFEAINAARSVRILTPGAGRPETSDVVSWSRREDRAVLRAPGAGNEAVERAPAELAVGDRCYFLDVQSDGSRVIVDTTVVGRSAAGDLVLNDLPSEATTGAPIFDEFGRVVARIAGSGLIGASLLDVRALADSRAALRGSWTRPLGAAPAPDAPSRSLLDLEEAGEFVKPLVPTHHFVSGVLGTGVDTRGPVPIAVGQGFRFSRRDGACFVFVTWNPAGKQDNTARFELYDDDNRRLGASDPRRVKLRSGQPFVQYWQMDVSRSRPGVYRVDVVLGTDPVWRTFFRVTE